MTIEYKNVYVKDTATVAGPYESKGPLATYFDKLYKKDLYFNVKSFEKAEVKLMKESVSTLLKKNNLTDQIIDLFIAGDLQNQLATSSYTARDFKIPFLGVYNACATSSESIIIGSTFIESGQIDNCICATASHNMAAEKQFRNPTEYGAPKPDSATFTVTGGASIMLTNEKTNIKITSATVGTPVDYNIKDVNNMGAVMACGAGDTIYQHLTNLKRHPNYYDLILTGDLGVYGKKILIDYMKESYNMNISTNYDDCGTMIYDLQNQSVYAGGSGPACSALVNYGYIYKMLMAKKMTKVLLVPTGALFNPISVFQKESIVAIAHAISLEVV